QSTAFTLDTRLPNGVVPSSATVVAESGGFTLDTRMPAGISPEGSVVIAESPPFTLDTRLSDGISSTNAIVIAESPPFTLDTRLPADTTPPASLVVMAESPPFTLDTRLPGDTAPLPNLVTEAETPPFTLDTRLPSDTTPLPNLITQTESPAFTLDTRIPPQDRLYTNLIAMAESGPFTLDTLSGWFNTPAQTLTGGSTGGKARFSPDGLRLAKTDGARILLWNLHSTRTNFSFTGHAAEVATLDFSPLGDQLLTGSADGTLRWWDTSSRAELGRINPPGGGTVYAAYAADGARIFAGRGVNAALYRVPAMQLIQEFGGSEGSISAVAVCPEGLALAGNSSRSALQWDAATGSILHRLTNHNKLITAAAFFPGGTNAMTASLDGTIRIWDTATGTERLVLQQGSPVIDAALSLDGTVLVSCCEGNPLAHGNGPIGTAYIWDAQSGAPTRVLSDETAPSQMNGVAISPDHTALATTYADGSVRLWNTGLEPRPIYPVTPLPIGTNAPVTLRSHGLYYFAVDAEAGRSLVVTLEADPGGGSKLKRSADIPVGISGGLSSDAEFANLGAPEADKNVGAPTSKSLQSPPPGADITAFRMTATKGHLPSVYDYETFAQASVTNLHCEMPMAFSSSNRVYVLVFAPYLAAGSITARIRAEYSDFHLSSVSPAEAGNAGSITVQIRGTGFTTNTLAKLAGRGATPVVGQMPLVIDSTEMFVTFDLQSCSVGTYDLRLEDTSFPAAVLTNGFLVKTGIGPRLETRLSAPASVRPGRKYTLYIEYENTGDADLPAPA
ncbi:MAG: WD40 repeat domain-containing protein, partial [Verrucomicrobia bacterium]|nr:WD40 repeat domain-containing protein [Verrucomicrobiota bacterium]